MRVHHRLSSVAYPHSNCRAEIGIQTVKRLVTDNSSPNGNLNTNAYNVQFFNTETHPIRTRRYRPRSAFSAVQLRISYQYPSPPVCYRPHPNWRETLSNREKALCNRHMRSAKRWTEQKKRHPPLVARDHVCVYRNQTNALPTKWDKTGLVIEVNQFDQYVVRVDDLGRKILRNRKFLGKYHHYTPIQPTTNHHQRPLIPRDVTKPTQPDAKTNSTTTMNHEKLSITNHLSTRTTSATYSTWTA